MPAPIFVSLLWAGISLIPLADIFFMSYKTSEERKKWSEDILSSRSIVFNPHLPLIEDSKEARFQSSREVAIRTQILGGLSETAFELSRLDCLNYFKDLKIWDKVSPSERDYLEAKDPEEQTIINMAWRIESNYVLFWSLGYVDELTEPIQLAELHQIHEQVRNSFDSAEKYFNSATLRDPEEILDQCDLIYRLHNAVRNAAHNGKSIPNGYDPSIVYERHFALNWLTCYQDDWDEITTDT